MAPVDEPEEAEPDDQKPGADLDLSLPRDEDEQQGEGEEHRERRQQVAGRQRPQRAGEGAWASVHQSG